MLLQLTLNKHKTSKFFYVIYLYHQNSEDTTLCFFLVIDFNKYTSLYKDHWFTMAMELRNQIGTFNMASLSESLMKTYILHSYFQIHSVVSYEDINLLQIDFNSIVIKTKCLSSQLTKKKVTIFITKINCSIK